METASSAAKFSIADNERRLDRLFVNLLWGHVALSLLLALWHGTYAQTLAIGVPTAALVAWLARVRPGELLTRCMAGVGMMVFSALFISQTHGLTEMHFHVFCALAFLLAYRDWRVVVVSAAAIAVHHLAFTALQTFRIPVFIYTTNTVNPWVLTVIHALFVVFESSILVYMAIGMRAEWVQQEKLDVYHQEMADIAEQIAEGNLLVQIEVQSEQDVFGQAFAKMIENVRILIGSLANSNEKVSATSVRLVEQMEQVRGGASRIAGTIAGVAQAAEQSAHASHEMANGSEQQAHCVMQATQSMERLQQTIQRVQEGSRQQQQTTLGIEQSLSQRAQVVAEVEQAAQAVAQAANQAQQIAHTGGAAVEQTIASIGRIREQVVASSIKVAELGKKGQEIGAIIETIDQIAEQTNLLALNAAIEAARAGENGKGFAVVADEVRKLAERAAAATREIAGLIGSVQTGVDDAVQAMDASNREVAHGVERSEEAGSALMQIQDSAQLVGTEVARVTSASGQMASEIQEILVSIQSVRVMAAENDQAVESMVGHSVQVSDAIGTVASISQKSAAGAQEMSASAAQVSTDALQVADVVAQQAISIESVGQEAGQLHLLMSEAQELMARFHLDWNRRKNEAPDYADERRKTDIHSAARQRFLGKASQVHADILSADAQDRAA